MASVADRQLEQWKARMAPLGRLPDEWVGKTPDAMPPGRVRDRILRGFGGKCAESGLEIRPGTTWHADHIIPVADGGMNAERNLQPLLDGPHKKKTRAEAKARAKADAARRAGNGTKAEPSKKIESPGFAPAPKQSKASKPLERFGTLPPRPMFIDVNEDET